MAPPTFNEEQIANLRHAWGFDKPIWEQYVHLHHPRRHRRLRSVNSGAAPGDGACFRAHGLYVSARSISSAVVGIAVALPLGILSALKRNSILDIGLTALTSLGTAMPSFWLGLMLILLFQ